MDSLLFQVPRLHSWVVTLDIQAISNIDYIAPRVRSLSWIALHVRKKSILLSRSQSSSLISLFFEMDFSDTSDMEREK